MIKRLIAEEDGQTLIEYALLTSLISVVCIVILGVLGRKTKDVFVTVNDKMTTHSQN
jgi:Flp pilus assembly pilin Flp